MANASASAYYGKFKRLRDDSWRGVGADIERRLACGDLRHDLNFLSFNDRAMTGEGWEVLRAVLQRLRSCTCLELQRCGIKGVGKLTALLPELVHKTKSFNLEGNTLTAKSVRKLAEAMALVYAHVRPTWLSIGDGAQAAASKCFVDTPCHPHHPRGCICSKPSVVHVVRRMPKYERSAKAQWEEEYLEPMERHMIKHAETPAKPSASPPKVSSEWPALPAQASSTAFTKTPSGGDSPKDLRAEDIWSDGEQPPVDGPLANDACSERGQLPSDAAPRAPSVGSVVGGVTDLVPIPTEADCAKPCASGATRLMSYVSLEKRARDMEILFRLASLSDICAAPLEAAARFTHNQAVAALADLRAGGDFTSWLIGERLLLLATSAEDRLLLVDLTESIARGDLVDARGAPACGARPLRGFNFRATALPFAARSDKHELVTQGGEQLEIHKQYTTHLASGWVAARRMGAPAFLWFPLEHCLTAA